MTTAELSKARITVCIPARLRANLELAASLRGMTLGGFVGSALAREAASVIESEPIIMFSVRDTEVILKALESPPKPNRAMRKAFKTHK